MKTGYFKTRNKKLGETETKTKQDKMKKHNYYLAAISIKRPFNGSENKLLALSMTADELLI